MIVLSQLYNKFDKQPYTPKGIILEADENDYEATLLRGRMRRPPQSCEAVKSGPRRGPQQYPLQVEEGLYKINTLIAAYANSQAEVLQMVVPK
ncbi:unnamed protein product [Lactuca saligna]|uniref:Uncharacterized protein n=1 Tax=Lactuca saligna TaxID=75948 RepID=A0AA35Z9M9_LACSI|nr:unnamed protein product [Lactuca saligna]